MRVDTPVGVGFIPPWAGPHMYLPALYQKRLLVGRGYMDDSPTSLRLVVEALQGFTHVGEGKLVAGLAENGRVDFLAGQYDIG